MRSFQIQKKEKLTTCMENKEWMTSSRENKLKEEEAEEAISTLTLMISLAVKEGDSISNNRRKSQELNSFLVVT